MPRDLLVAVFARGVLLTNEGVAEQGAHVVGQALFVVRFVVVFLDLANLKFEPLPVPVRAGELHVVRGVVNVGSSGEVVVQLWGRPVGALTHEGPLGTAREHVAAHFNLWSVLLRNGRGRLWDRGVIHNTTPPTLRTHHSHAVLGAGSLGREGHCLEVCLLVLPLHLLEQLDHVLALGLEIDFAALRQVPFECCHFCEEAVRGHRPVEVSQVVWGLHDGNALAGGTTLGAGSLVHVAGLGADRLMVALSRSHVVQGTGSCWDMVNLRRRPTQLNRSPPAVDRLRSVEVLLFGPLGVDLCFHPAAVEVDDGLPVLELAESFRGLQVPELRQVNLVDGGLVEKVIDDLSLPVVGVETLPEREHVEGVALEVAELGVEVGPRQVFGGVTGLSSSFLRQDLVYVVLLH